MKSVKQRHWLQRSQIYIKLLGYRTTPAKTPSITPHSTALHPTQELNALTSTDQAPYPSTRHQPPKCPPSYNPQSQNPA